MIDSASYLAMESVTFSELTFRVFLASAFAFVLGWDRDTKNKPIDFRAYIIVAVTTCVLAVISQELFAELDTGDGTPLDYAKLISGAMTGIGFLGAGAIIHKQDNIVVGTATGASIWAAGGIGLAIGFGFYALALIAFIAIAASLILGGFCMKTFYGREDDEDKK